MRGVDLLPPLMGEVAPLNWRPSAEAVAGNRWDGERGGTQAFLWHNSSGPPPPPLPPPPPPPRRPPAEAVAGNRWDGERGGTQAFLWHNSSGHPHPNPPPSRGRGPACMLPI